MKLWKYVKPNEVINVGERSCGSQTITHPRM